MNCIWVATFVPMNRILGILLLVALTNGLWSQSAPNPFDLKYRKSKSPSSLEKQQAKTPRDTVEDVIQITKPENVQAKNFDTTPSNIEAIGDTLLQAADSFSIDLNPFETGASTDSAAGGSVAEKDSSASNEGVIGPPRKQFGSRGFQIFFLLLSLLFLIFVVNVERSFIRDLWRVISNENYSSLHHRNQRNTMRQILLLMGYSIFVFQAGLFINQSLIVYGLTGSILSNIWFSMGLVLGIYLVRHAVIRYLKWLFNNEKELSLYAFDISIFNTMVGMILLPINILLIFGPDTMFNALIIIGVITIGAAYLLRQLRWLVTAQMKIASSLFLFFIYLCAIEILPLWTISKLFW